MTIALRRAALARATLAAAAGRLEPAPLLVGLAPDRRVIAAVTWRAPWAVGARLVSLAVFVGCSRLVGIGTSWTSPVRCGLCGLPCGEGWPDHLLWDRTLGPADLRVQR